MSTDPALEPPPNCPSTTASLIHWYNQKKKKMKQFGIWVAHTTIFFGKLSWKSCASDESRMKFMYIAQTSPSSGAILRTMFCATLCPLVIFFVFLNHTKPKMGDRIAQAPQIDFRPTRLMAISSVNLPSSSFKQNGSSQTMEIVVCVLLCRGNHYPVFKVPIKNENLVSFMITICPHKNVRKPSFQNIPCFIDIMTPYCCFALPNFVTSVIFY